MSEYLKTNKVKVNGITYDIEDSNTKIALETEIIRAKEVEQELESSIESCRNDLNTLQGTGEGSVSGMIENAISEVIGSAPETLNTLQEISEWIQEEEIKLEEITNKVSDLEGEQRLKTEEILWSNLLLKASKEELIPGQYYRIVDFVTTTKQNNTTTAGHNFDLVVQALDNKTLSEEAKAYRHKNDTYFSNSKLESWEIKYCVENNTSRFAWADVNSGKGVIYYLKDEFGNEAGYDFKNIQFKRDATWLSSHKSNFTGLKNSTQSELWFYTFSRISGTTIVSITDDSLNEGLSSSIYPCRNNTIGAYSKREGSVLNYILNNTIFIGNGAESNHFGENNCNNTFTGIYNNYFDMGCQDNTVYKSFSTNHVGIKFQSNIINGSFNYNEIESNFYGNQLGSILSCHVRDGFKENNSLGKTIQYCDFGNFIQRCSDLPSMMNVAFSNEVIKNTNYGEGLGNVTLTTGETALSALSRLANNTSKVLFTKQNDKYQVIYIAENGDKLESIYDLGNFSSNKGGENAAYNINIIRNPKILFLRFYNTTSKKYVLLQQNIVNLNPGVGEWGNTKQYIYLDGRKDVRNCWFQNVLGNYQTASDANHTTDWIPCVGANNEVYSEGHEIVTNPIRTAINTNYNNDANCGGYYGKLSDFGVFGGNINLKTISVYRRSGSVKNEFSVQCKVLGKVNESWYLIAKSDNLENISSKSEGGEAKFNMVMQDNIPALTSSNKVAIIFTNDVNSEINSYVTVSVKTLLGAGGITTLSGNLNVNPNNISSGWKPCMSFKYSSLESDSSTVHTNIDEEIDSIKTFNKKIYTKGNIIITDSDGDKSIIRTDIDTGELKVTKPNSNNGFIIKTDSSVTHGNKEQLILLTTNGSSSFKYCFPVSKLVDNGSYEVILSNVEIKYDDLVNLRDSNSLIPGIKYRIIDYITLVTENNISKSAEHQFDIIVEALTENTLNEEAKACLHEGDTYFSEYGAKLGAWKIWYCLDNDKSKYQWLTNVDEGEKECKGVIYRMIDEWDNDCPYDFKNIQFYRENTNEWYYTFSWVNEESLIEDLSLKQNLPSNNNNHYHTTNNKISPYYIDVQYLNNIVFISTWSYSQGMFFGCYSNRFGFNCHNNTLGNSNNLNIFSDYSSYNIFDINCSNNSFGKNFTDNIAINFYNCSAGNSCQNNSFNNTYSIILGDNCKYLEIESENLYISSNIRGNETNQLVFKYSDNATKRAVLNSKGEVKVYCEADLIQ